jgi:predicted transcriptional regulator of viral defense system
MTSDCRCVGHLVTRMQEVFLDAPATTLALNEAQQRFGVSRNTCEGVLDALTDAGVLARTPRGEYVRHFPHRHGSRARHAA